MDVQYHEEEVDDEEHNKYTKSEAFVKWLMQPHVLKEWYDTANGHRLAFNRGMWDEEGSPPFNMFCENAYRNIKDDTYIRWAPVEFEAFSKCRVTFCCDYPKLFFDGEYDPEVPDDFSDDDDPFGEHREFWDWHEWEFGPDRRPGPHFTMALWLDSYDGEWVDSEDKNWYDKKYPFWSSTIDVSDLRQARMFCYGMLKLDGGMAERSYSREETDGHVKTPMLKKAKYHWHLVRRHAFLVWPNVLYWQREAAKPGSVGSSSRGPRTPFLGPRTVGGVSVFTVQCVSAGVCLYASRVPSPFTPPTQSRARRPTRTQTDEFHQVRQSTRKQSWYSNVRDGLFKVR